MRLRFVFIRYTRNEDEEGYEFKIAEVVNAIVQLGEYQNRFFCFSPTSLETITKKKRGRGMEILLFSIFPTSIQKCCLTKAQN